MDFREVTEFLKDMSKYIVVIIIVLVLAIYVISLQQVVGESMSPTLKDGDILLLSKMHYKLFKVERNDIIALSYDNSKYLIKRVIGLPGEEVYYKDNVLYINGEGFTEGIVEGLVTEDFTFEQIITNSGLSTDVTVIPENMYLVLGDNRGDSLDSRDIGLISEDEILGKTLARIWPLNGFKVLD